MNMLKLLAEEYFESKCTLEFNTKSTEVVLVISSDMEAIKFNNIKKDFRKELLKLGFKQLLSNLSIIRG